MKRKSKSLRQIIEERRHVPPIEPDHARRFSSFLVTASILIAFLLIADAIVYLIIPSDKSRPFEISIVEFPVFEKADEPGEQLDEPVVEPEREHQPEPVEQVVEEPPAEEKLPPVDNPSPVDNPAPSQEPVIARTSSGPSRAYYGNRGGGARAQALAKYGGGDDTEDAVRRGLEWLARHQHADGSWRRCEFGKNCRGNICNGAGAIPVVPCDSAITGLALLAMSGSNNTHKDGPFREEVAAGIKYLCRIQTNDGRFGDYPRELNQYMMYNQGIATFALSELYAMTQDPELKPYVERAVRFIIAAQQTSGGWDYTDAKTGRYDTSVTGWQVMALKSASSAGVDVPSYTLFKLMAFIDSVTLPNGDVIYSNMDPGHGRRGQGMVAVGMASLQFLGFPSNTKMSQYQQSIILANLPDWQKLNKAENFDSVYYWYYASIALFQAGGDAWQKWNIEIKKTLLTQQRRGGCFDGSWDVPQNFWGVIGGRVYITSLCVLNLEIYYRYLPLLESDGTKTIDALIEIARGKNAGDTYQAVRLLGRFEGERARQFLAEMASSANPKLALEAAVALAERRDPLSIEPLRAQLKSDDQFARYRALRALAPMMCDGLVPDFIQCLRDEKATVARQADQFLRQYANVSFDFDPEVSVEQRETAIRKWEIWWEQQQKAAASSRAWPISSVIVERGMVAFSLDADAPATLGKKFNVYRENQCVGRINVVSTDGKMAVGKIVEEYSGEIREGDVVRP